MSNAERHYLQQGLEEFLGEQRANLLMEHLPPVGWADLATKRDLDNLEERLRGQFRHDMVQLRSDLQLQMAELRLNMSELRSELQHDMSELRSELQHDMSELRSELQHDMSELRSELQHDMSELRSELRLDMSELRSELRLDMGELRQDTTGSLSAFQAQLSDLRTAIAAQQLRHTIAVVGILGTLIAVLNAFN